MGDRQKCRRACLEVVNIKCVDKSSVKAINGWIGGKIWWSACFDSNSVSQQISKTKMWPMEGYYPSYIVILDKYFSNVTKNAFITLKYPKVLCNKTKILHCLFSILFYFSNEHKLQV